MFNSTVKVLFRIALDKGNNFKIREFGWIFGKTRTISPCYKLPLVGVNIPKHILGIIPLVKGTFLSTLVVNLSKVRKEIVQTDNMLKFQMGKRAVGCDKIFFVWHLAETWLWIKSHQNDTRRHRTVWPKQFNDCGNQHFNVPVMSEVMCTISHNLKVQEC